VLSPANWFLKNELGIRISIVMLFSGLELHARIKCSEFEPRTLIFCLIKVSIC
jgi:hypothetical protein